MATTKTPKKTPKKPPKKAPKHATPKPAPTRASPKEGPAEDANAPTPQEAAARRKLAAIFHEFNSALSVLSQAERVAAAKPIYEAAFPESKVGGAAGRAGGGKVAKPDRMSAFAEYVAREIACSARHVRRLVAVGEIPRPVRRQIGGTKLANRTVDLVNLSRMKEAEQVAAVNAYRSKPGGDLSAFKKVVRKFVKPPKKEAKEPWALPPILLPPPGRPMPVKLPVGTICIELIETEGHFHIRFTQPTKVDPRGPGEIADDLLRHQGIEVANNAHHAAISPAAKTTNSRAVKPVKVTFPAWADLERGECDPTTVREIVEALAGPRDHVGPRMNASDVENVTHGLTSKNRRSARAGNVVLVEFVTKDGSECLVARYDEGGRALLPGAFRLAVDGSVTPADLPKDKKPDWAWMRRSRSKPLMRDSAS